MNIEQFDYSTDLLAVILWQYNEATNLLSLLNQKQAWYDVNQTQFWQNWYNQVFNLGAPNTNMSLFGLAVWSIILDVPLYVPLVPVEPGVVWGFNAFDPSFPDYENDNLNFNNAPFPPTTPVIALTPYQQQFLLLLKYFNCTTRGTLSWPISSTNFSQDTTENQIYTNNFVYNINQYLQYLCFYLGDAIGYGENTIVCNDNLNMTISYVFSDPTAFPSTLLQAINLLDLLPRPAGVAIV
jgi:hypothetical protein